MVEQFVVNTPFDEGRKVNVYLPKGYNNSKDRYPVIYMFDGHNLFSDSEATFGKCWGLKEFMDNYKKKMIIVGVYCNTVGNNRLIEYFPYKTTPNRVIPEFFIGKGKTYMDWMVNEFMPLINNKYRTLTGRENTMIAGSSMGGLMSLYAIINYNNTFKYAACLSSTIMICMDQLLEDCKEAKLNKDTKIYMDYGAQEWEPDQIIECHQKIEDALRDKVNFHFYFDVKGSHNEASWEKRVPIYMKYLFE